MLIQIIIYMKIWIFMVVLNQLVIGYHLILLINYGGLCIKRLKNFGGIDNHINSKDDVDTVYRTVIYNTPKKLLQGLNDLGIMLGFSNRSKLINFIIKHFYDNYTYLLNNDSVLYIFIDYNINSYADINIMDIQKKYKDFEIISVKKIDDDVNRLILSYSGDINNLNNVVKPIIDLDSIYKIRFIGM